MEMSVPVVERWVIIMKRIMCAIFILAMVVVFVTPSAYAKSEATVESAAVSFDKLAELVKAKSYDYQKDLQEIRKIELSIEDLESDLVDLYKLFREGTDVFQEINEQHLKILDAENSLSNLQDGLKNSLKQHVYQAQKLYINHFLLLLDVDIAQQELEILEKTHTSAMQKLSRGLISQNSVSIAEKSMDNQKKNVKAALTNVDENLEILTKYLGLETTITISDMPEMDFKRITGRDMKADLAAYILAASSTVEKAMKAANDRYSRSKLSIDSYIFTIYRQEFEKTKKEAEKEFTKTYEKLKDAYNEFVNSTALTDAQKDYSMNEAQFARGIIPLNKMLSSERALHNAEIQQKKSEIQVWLHLMEYENSLLQ